MHTDMTTIAAMTSKSVDPHPALTGMLASESDLVDRIFDYLLDVVPALSSDAEKLAEAKAAVRDEFGGVDTYIRSGRSQARTEQSHRTARDVMSLFNGRNATEIARRLGIGRTTVYRIIKTSGRR